MIVTRVVGASAAMRSNWRSTAALAVIVFSTLLQVAHAQPSPPPGMRGGAGGMATRSVSNYLTRERTLQDAIERRDRAAVTAVLAADFEQRSAFVPDLAAADDWLRSEFASKQPQGVVRELSVREVDDVAIVSFLLDRGPAGRPASTTWFVVDVWGKSSQLLLARSITRAARTPPKHVRPTGRE